MRSRFLGVLVAALTAPILVLTADQAPPQAAGGTDLDTLMARALAHRDENWKKLQQYVLDERETIEVREPNGKIMFGDHRDYTWYIRDGFFLRSPVKANGVTVPEADRRKYERQWLEREKRRERAAARGQQPAQADADDIQVAEDVGGLLKQSREPRFVSAGYFLEFKFEPGNYYLAGRETVNGKNLLKIEYYPIDLFGEDRARRRNRRPPDEKQREIDEKMNKTALVTLWVEPDTAEIRKYTFDNLGLGFLPLSWLMQVTEMRANVNMLEPFPGVLLPGTVDIDVAITLANGSYKVNYDLEYFGYKEAKSRSTIITP